MIKILLGVLVVLVFAQPGEAKPRHSTHHHRILRAHKHRARHSSTKHHRVLRRHTHRWRQILDIRWRASYEAPLSAEHSSILATARRYLGSRNFTGHRGIPWCAAAIGSWLRQAGYASLRSLRAIDYLHYGAPTWPHIGALAVLRHHIGIVAGLTARGVLLLSGNHGHRVAYGIYSMYRILGFREPVPWM